MEIQDRQILQHKKRETFNQRRDTHADKGNNFGNTNSKVPFEIISELPKSQHPWDRSHQLVREDKELAFAEPEVDALTNEYVDQLTRQEADIANKDENSYYEYLSFWPHPEKPSGWYLEDAYSQIRSAKTYVESLNSKHTVRIAHLDTGYSEAHVSFPKDIINFKLQRNFVPGEEDRLFDASDDFSNNFLQMPGHGTGTLSILAGAKVNIPQYNFDDYIGLCNNVEIVPIRIAKSVILFKTGAFAKAMDYIINELGTNDSTRVHVLSMSMGGIPSKIWADMVNLAYDNGIFMVTAAGNNFGKLTPRRLVYPARFNRVVAACGVAYDYSPYSKTSGQSSPTIMEGNYGPSFLMKNAIAAFTPNVFWATYHYNNIVGIRGDGTSSATPQIAAAAALYYIKNYEQLESLPQKWMRVEAIKKAIFNTAKQEISSNFEAGDWRKYFGNGVLQARKMMDYAVTQPSFNDKADLDHVVFPILKTVFGLRKMDEDEQQEELMYETELMQLVISDHGLSQILNDEETKVTAMALHQQLAFVEQVIQNPKASVALKEKMAQAKATLESVL